MNRQFTGIVLSVAVLCAATGCSQAYKAPTTIVTTAASPETATPMPAHSAGMTIYKDPATGRLMPLPADQLEQLLAASPRSVSADSDEGLVETPTPGGGTMVNLRGRFRGYVLATASSDGTVRTQCDQHAPKE